MKSVSSILRLLRRYGEDHRGAILAEVALGSIVLIALFMAVLDFGLAYSRQLEMMNAARAGTQPVSYTHLTLATIYSV